MTNARAVAEKCAEICERGVMSTSDTALSPQRQMAFAIRTYAATLPDAPPRSPDGNEEPK